jgi:uncharacterized protein YecE (DUF72 family)
MKKLLLGTSGWDYQEWIGPFYRSATESKLQAYSRVFGTAEINSSFYRKPNPATVQGWLRYSPEEFVFAAKVPQTVTHDRRLDPSARAELVEFCDLMRPLAEAGKLGPLLLQLPPSLRFDPRALAGFLAILPSDFQFAMEFRNRSWMVPEAFDLLRDHGVAYAVVDEPLLPPEVHVTAPIAYVRWHGHGQDPWYDYRYSREELQAWVPRVEEMAAKAKVTYGYFNNHYHGYAPENCLEVLEMLGQATPLQRESLRRMREAREGIVRTATGRVRAVTLEAFGGGPGPAAAPTTYTVEDLLGEFLDGGRILRAKGIGAEEVELSSAGDVLEGRVHGYAVTIDPFERLVMHDCDDFRRRAARGLFCKHLGRFFLSLPPVRAETILRAMAGDRAKWRFLVPGQGP